MITTEISAFPDTLRAISIAGPFAYEIAIGEKRSECRTWPTKFRGLVLLHVSQSKEYGDPQSPDMVSAIIGAAELYNCTPDPFRPGYFDHHMRYPILFEEYIRNVSGNRNYWHPKTSDHELAFSRAWAQIPKSEFCIERQGNIIRIASQKTDQTFDVLAQGIWEEFAPRIQDSKILLTKAEFARLYHQRQDSQPNRTD
ncbi:MULTISPECIES: hypothetical protein [Cyanophyceae]|uniref:ASCH domain-containing protein n=1 Tax=Leptolyngbya subtilissima DQ-A4 TaxID=2933933 RepID=A0ABV0JZG3_9CYAN|nr:hypothetical protein [Nodosilinea sp. FACHB-141]MBD2112542.1 hypothetical protein [Nodosilinea sp. FACHB-141]